MDEAKERDEKRKLSQDQRRIVKFDVKVEGLGLAFDRCCQSSADLGFLKQNYFYPGPELFSNRNLILP